MLFSGPGTIGYASNCALCNRHSLLGSYGLHHLLDTEDVHNYNGLYKQVFAKARRTPRLKWSHMLDSASNRLYLQD